MKASSWDSFYQRYQQWMFMVTEHYNFLVGHQDRHQESQLMRLWEYQTQAQTRLRLNAISQDEWDRQKSSV